MENKPTTDKIVIVVHGFKRQGTNDFTDFVEYATDKVKYPIHNFTFFENEQKNTLGYKTMSSRIGTEFSKFADKEIIVIGYSIGGLSAIAHSVKMNNITAIYSIVPAYKIKYFE
ncbi:MAG: hypothetical protein DRP42_01940 [Tenericutes bacterium]|nr:MAG: hypothetical protein DRP42_01940 [Mycoplasmatota bacterium]